MSQTQTKTPPVRRGPMGGGMGPGEKPKNFKRTLGKLMRYMRSSLPVVILSFLLAIGSVVLTINVPKITGGATDKLFAGATDITLFNVANDAVTSADLPQLKDLATPTVATVGDLLDADIDQSADPVRYKAQQVLLSVLSRSESLGQDTAPLLAVRLSVRPEMPIKEIIDVLAVAIVFILIAAAVGYIQGFILAGVAQKVAYRFRRDIDQKINKLPLKYYDTTSNGEVLSYLTNDVDTISMTLNQSLSQLITSVTTLVGVLIMMFTISWLLTLIALVIIPLSFGLIILVVKLSQKHFIGQQRFLGEVNSHIEEQYAGHKVVQLYNGQDGSVEKFDVYNKKLCKSARMAQFLSGLMMPIMNFVGNIGYVAVVVTGGAMVIGNMGGMTIGKIQAFIAYVRQFNQPISQMANLMNTLQSAVAAAERVFGFIEADEELETGDCVPQNVRGDVMFEHVRFGYNPENIIVQDFSSTVHAGDRVAIVGPTGAGKTTIVKLLMRFYDLNGGEIKLDGVPISQFSRKDLRNELGMVLQDTWLYNGTIMDNIRYGKLNATDEEVKKAAKIACADHFIRTLPGGYDFVINEEAANISQGQKQLLTIARAVLNDPKVLILDEATSSVDTRTEILIQKAMDRLMQGRTSFIIAHRLSTIKDADKILVMKDGDIIEQGSHSQLMAQKGFYETLYNSQFA